MAETITVDLEDPCARAQSLREAFYRVVQGEQEQMIRYLGNGVDREVRYTPVKLELLRAELRVAETECAEQQGRTGRRRFAIQGHGYRVVGGLR